MPALPWFSAWSQRKEHSILNIQIILLSSLSVLPRFANNSCLVCGSWKDRSTWWHAYKYSGWRVECHSTPFELTTYMVTFWYHNWTNPKLRLWSTLQILVVASLKFSFNYFVFYLLQHTLKILTSKLVH